MTKLAALIAGGASFAIQAGLQVSGVQSLPLAISLWSLGGVLVILAAALHLHPLLARITSALRNQPSITVRYLPEERSEWEFSNQEWIHLAVRNNGPTEDFVAQISGVDGAFEKQTPWSVKWRGHAGETRTIFHGTEQLLDLAQATPPEHNPYGVQDAIKRGVFRFYSSHNPDGWEVTPGPRELFGSLHELQKRSIYDEGISLKLRVTSAGTTDSPSRSAAKEIRLRFLRPDESDRRIRVDLCEWVDG